MPRCSPRSLPLPAQVISMNEVMAPERDDAECDRRLIAVPIPKWVRSLVNKGDQVTAVFDDEYRCRWLINEREVLPSAAEGQKP